MSSQIYECSNYKKYLNANLDKRGDKSRFAEALGCNTAYVSLVITGNAHLSLEQAELASRFFGLSNNEELYFIFLVQHARSGTEALKRIIATQLQNLRDESLNLKNRLEYSLELDETAQSIYYGAWYYSAIHVLTSIPSFRTPESISKYLGLPLKTVNQALEFLVRTGLVEMKKESGKYHVGNKSLHINADSPHISRHHSNWRLQSIKSLDSLSSEDLHYSSVISMSEEDQPQVRAILTEAIEKIRNVVRKSGEEKAYCYTLDFFDIKKSIYS